MQLTNALRRARFHGALLATALTLTAGGCLPDTTVGGDGLVSVSVGASNRGRVVSAVITLQGVDFVPQGDSAATPVLTEPARVNLIAGMTSPVQVVPAALLREGSYTGLRFRISGGYVEVDNGDSTTSVYASAPDYSGLPAGTTVDGELTLPSDVPKEVVAALPGGGLTVSGTANGFLAQLDLARSFTPAADSASWALDPVIAVSDLSGSGALIVDLRLASSVTLPSVNGRQVTIADFTLRATDGTGAVRESRFVADHPRQGTAQVGPLVAGSARVEIVPPEGVTIETDRGSPFTVDIPTGTAFSTTATITSAGTTGG